MMRRKASQDSNTSDVGSHHHNDDPDYTPNKLRVSPYSSSSNFHIDHGSSDYNLSQQQHQQQQQLAIPSPGECDSPGSISLEGLHHRKTHSSSSYSQYNNAAHHHPIQQTNLLGGRISPEYLRHPLATASATSSTNKKKVHHHQYTNTRKRTALNRVGNNNTTKVGSYSLTWKRIIQCLFITLIGGYILFLYLMLCMLL